MTTLQERFTKPSGWTEGYMINERGNPLRWGGSAPTPTQAKAHIVYIQGLSEYAEKTFELARDFNKHACGFWTLDRHGQGLSGRYLADKFKQHSAGFDLDAADIIKLVRDIVPKDGKPIIILGHSTGGLVGMLALSKSPDLFSGAFFTSPLFGLVRPIAKNRESLVAKFLIPRFIRESYIMGSGQWKERNTTPGANEGEDFFSSDPERMKIHSHWQKANPDLRVGGPTYGWGQEVCRSITKIHNKDLLADIKKPVHIFTCGHEGLVNNSAVHKVYKNLPDANYTHFPKGKHELLMEQDYIRSRILNSVVDFVNKQNPAP